MAVALALLGGCASIPPGRSAVDDVTLRGTDQVDDDDIEERIATAPSPRFLNLFQGVVYDYEIFNRFVLQRDLARIERYYRARGFYQARVQAGRIRRVSDDKVHVEIVIKEGPAVLVNRITIAGLTGLPPTIRGEVTTAVQGRLVKGEPFEEEAFEASEASARRALTDRGYAYAKVTRDAAVDIVARTADVVLTVDPGAPMKFGAVRIVGLGGLPEGPVLRALDIEPGDEYATSTLESAQQATLDLGVFTSVQITPLLGADPPPSGRVPVEVKVEVSRLHTVRLGGGIEFDAIKTDVHLRAGWEDRNFLGGFRSFSVDARPGVVLYPLRLNNLVAPEHPLPELRLLTKLQQPGLFEARTNGFFRSDFTAFPVLLKVETDVDDPVLGYAEFKETAGLDRTFWKLYGNLSQSVQIDVPFPYVGDLDPSLRTLVISYPELILNLDLRDDRIHPHKGIFVGNNVQVGVLGDARDVRTQPEIRGYVPIGKRLTLASRASVGLLFPFNYGGTIADQLSGAAAAPTGPDQVRDLQLLFFRGFFSGGSNSNRGYAHGTISPHGIVPFLSPQIEADRIARECEPGSPSFDPARCSIPIGGMSLWEASLELRLDLDGPLSLAAFCDTSDVSPDQADLRLNHPHLSCGLGVRYDTPVGPIRLDVGYRIPGAQVLETVDPRVEGDPGDIFGVPLAIAFGIGEAF
jgi:outer membrane protein insertion porin family/translocation and assembly module TamA